MKDLFICHAHEDKEAIVKPLIKSLRTVGINCWEDNSEILWGDSLVHKVNDGLKTSNYVVVVLSLNFISKSWPKMELNSALNIEASTGDVKVLPLLVGSESEKQIILQQYPIIAGKLYFEWDRGIEAIISELQKRISLDEVQIRQHDPVSSFKGSIPKIPKSFTQKEKDLFTRQSYESIKEYFMRGLSTMQQQYSYVEPDFIEIDNFSFLSKIYVKGNLLTEFMVYINPYGSENAIFFREGKIETRNSNILDNSLQIAEDRFDLYWQASSMFNYINNQKKDLFTQEKMVAFLWRKFSSNIENAQNKTN